MFVTLDETPGSAPVATIHAADGTQKAVWVGWNQSYPDLDDWLRACGYCRTSFDPIEENGDTTVFELAKR